MITSIPFLNKLYCKSLLLIFLSCSLWGLIGQSGSVYAQTLSTDTAEDLPEVSQPEWPEDSLGRRTPRGTVSGFISAVADQNYSRASRYLNLDPSLYGSPEGARLAQTLQRLLDQRGNILPYARISNEPDGQVDDGLRSNLDRVGTINAGGETIDVYLEEIPGPGGGPIWLFSAETIEKISTISGEATAPLVDRVMPDVLQENRWEGVAIGQWLSIFIIAALAYLLAWTLTSIGVFLIRRFWKQAVTEPTAGIIKALALPIRLYLAVWIFVASTEAIGLSIIVRQRFSGITIIVGLVAFLLLLWRLTEFITGFSEKRMRMRGQAAGVSAILFLRRAAKIMIVVFGIIAVLGSIGVDVTTGLAALGIGGIALALGAQKTVENFVGSVTLIADQPIRVGDFCKAGDTVGTVEEIGMRSTRIRTLDRTLVTIPNGEFSSTKIENYAHRDRFWFHPVFGLRYETSPDQIRFLLVELRSILYAHPKVDPNPARVRFIEFGPSSLNIEVFAYVNALNFDEFLEVKEDLFLRMMDVVEASGTGFAFPSQTLYLARDKGLSEEKIRDAEEKVKKWREEGDMQIPGFDAARINELKNSISYPPQGSVKQNNTKK